MDREESTNSSEENSDHDQAGVGRSYECVFCKRGFNTAQALGGHMNIHRKDRARNKPNSTKQPPRPIPQHPYATYFPTAAAAADNSSNSTLYETTYDNHDRSRHQPSSDPAVDPRDWSMRFSFQFAPSIVEGDRRGMEQEKELDLELRLGYDS